MRLTDPQVFGIVAASKRLEKQWVFFQLGSSPLLVLRKDVVHVFVGHVLWCGGSHTAVRRRAVGLIDIHAIINIAVWIDVESFVWRMGMTKSIHVALSWTNEGFGHRQRILKENQGSRKKVNLHRCFAWDALPFVWGCWFINAGRRRQYIVDVWQL